MADLPAGVITRLYPNVCMERSNPADVVACLLECICTGVVALGVVAGKEIQKKRLKLIEHM